MKTMKQFCSWGGAVAALALVLTCLWLFMSRLDARSTYDIAEGAFTDLAQHLQLPVSDFDPPPPVREGDRSVTLELDWKSKSKIGCRIEVDVDRRFGNARPAWSCEETKGSRLE